MCSPLVPDFNTKFSGLKAKQEGIKDQLETFHLTKSSVLRYVKILGSMKVFRGTSLKLRVFIDNHNLQARSSDQYFI